MPKGRNAEVGDDEIVEALRGWPRGGGDVYPSTSTVRDEIEEKHGVDYNRKTLYRRLDSLESEGEIDKIEVGQGRGKSVGWYAENRLQEPEGSVTGPGSHAPPERGDSQPAPEEETKQETKRESMDLASVLVLALVAGTVAFVGLQSLSLFVRAYKKTDIVDGWAVDVRETARVAGYGVAVVASGVLSVGGGYLIASYLWAINPAYTGFVAVGGLLVAVVLMVT